MNALTTIAMTMTSREIADLIEKQHSHIKVSAERLAEKGVIGTLATREFTHNGNVYTEYLLNKRDSLILVAQNCPEFTAKLVDRWQELEAQATQPALNPANFSRMQLIEIAMQAEQERMVLETKVVQIEAEKATVQATLAIAAPKAEALDRIADADGAMNPTVAAKALQVQPKKLFDYLRTQHWIYRRPGGSGNVAYQDKIQSGYLTHKITTVQREDGTEKVVEQVLVTGKGLTKLSQALGMH